MTVVTNEGNVVIWPVIHVYGSFVVNDFSILNNSVLDNFGNPLGFYYNPIPIGPAIGIPPGDYAIIDMFKSNIILASSGFDLADGVEMLRTDFFPLIPGANNLTTFGGSPGGFEIVRPVTAWA
jgi:hypothetical protein